MIKAIILDVDGVIIGKKTGFNFPNPHPSVMKRLEQVKQKGISIALCTAKPQFSINTIIKKIGLDNYHIADGGAVIINPIQDKIVKKNLIESQLAKKIVEFFIKENTYTEIYTVYNYYIQESQISGITAKHIPILLKKPKIVNSLVEESVKSEITKIMLVAKNVEDKERIIKLLKPFERRINIYWGLHPSALPIQFGVLTGLGVSKKQGVIEISKNINIPLKNILGVGDATGDWQFIELCGYGGAMGNASKELKKLVLSKGKKYSFVGKPIDENGVLSILDNFSL